MTSPLVLQKSDGSGAAVWQTEVRLSHDAEVLYVEFCCRDDDAWGTYDRRDDPLWQEEVVEVFLSPGEDCPETYFEFEISPHGILFDARVSNPDGQRQTMSVDTSWNCPGIEWTAAPLGSSHDWRAELALPWRGLMGENPVPNIWRANFFRIERPRQGDEEFTAWSPTLRSPPDFHVPSHFGYLLFANTTAPIARGSSHSPSLPFHHVARR